jgi:predicted GIY-YIG superfamily endonuclease
MKKCKNNFNPLLNGINGYSFNKFFLYTLISTNGLIKYVGITSDIKQTLNRHYKHNSKLKIVGEFYDRNLAEFFEITLIKELLSKGIELENKVTDFTGNENINL